MDAFDPDDSRYFACSNLIACRAIGYDNTNADAGYSLSGVLVHVRPLSSAGFPFVVARQCLFAQVFGTAGEYVVRIRQVRIEAGDEDEMNAVEMTDFGPWNILIPGDSYVECFGFALTDAQYPVAGVYEFQLWADGFDHPLGSERVQARV